MSHLSRKEAARRQKAEGKRREKESRHQQHRDQKDSQPAVKPEKPVVKRQDNSAVAVADLPEVITRPSLERFFPSILLSLEPQHFLSWGDWPAIVADLGEKLRIKPKVELLAMLPPKEYGQRAVSAEAYVAVFQLLTALQSYLGDSVPFFSDGATQPLAEADVWTEDDGAALQLRLEEIQQAWDQAKIKAKSGQPDKLLQALLAELNPDGFNSAGGKGSKASGKSAELEIKPLDLPEVLNQAGLQVVNLPINRITRNPDQPRTKFDSEKLKGLGESLKVRQLQPIVVFPIEDDPDHDYMLFAGERRCRAAKLVGLSTLAAIIIDKMNPRHLYVAALLENEHREQLDELDEANAFAKLIKDYGMTVGSIAFHCGKSLPTVRSRLKLLKLSPRVQAMIGQHVPEEERLPLPVACLLSQYPYAKQEELAAAFKLERVRTQDVVAWLRRKLEGSGLKVDARSESSNRDDARMLLTFLDHVHVKCEAWSHMPIERFIGMFKNRPPEFMRGIVGRLAEDTKYLSGLEKKLRFYALGEADKPKQ